MATGQYCPHCRLRIYAGRCGCGQWQKHGDTYIRTSKISDEMTQLSAVSSSSDPRQFLADVLIFMSKLGQ